MAIHLVYNTFITHQHICKKDYEGKVVTTLIESKENQNQATQTLLYVHGFNDYFFQYHLFDFYAAQGINFYAIDLRKCGRSYLSHQHPNFCKSLEEYFEDLEYAIDFIKKKDSKTQLYFLGHSTGGVLVSYYALIGSKKDNIAGLILNSPFLEFNLPYLLRKSIPLLMWFGLKLHPYLAFSASVSPIYGMSLLKEYGGEWEFDTKMKPTYSFPAYLAWIRAVYKVQRIIAESKLTIPILLMHSDSSSKPKELTLSARKTDVVLNVAHIDAIGMKMGTDVTQCVVEDGVHDLFLSKEKARTFALNATIDFLVKQEEKQKATS